MTTSTPLARHIAARIAEQIRNDGRAKGSRLVERALAEQLKVSRSPVRGALRLLAAQGLVAAAGSGGYVVANPGSGQVPAGEASETREQHYLRIAEDRLDGVLPDRVTENELIRRYSMSRAELSKVLRQITGEGWIERLPGHGWSFLPMLTSLESYEDSYRYRLTIEPSAILEPRFELDASGLAACRSQQQDLVDGEIWTVSKIELFERNSRLHETIIQCSRNIFFIDGLKRIDRLRRLMEYRQSLDRPRALVRCREHLEIIDLLLAGRRREASLAMAGHLSGVSAEKIVARPEG